MFSPCLCLNLLKLESSSCFCLPSPAVNFWDIVLRQEIQQVDAGFGQWIQLIHIFYTNVKKKKNPTDNFAYLFCTYVDWPLSAGAPELISISNTQPDSGKHPSPPETMILSGKHKHTQTHSQRGKYTVTQFNRIPVFLLCGSVCFVCSLYNNSAEKTTMLNAATRLPICVYKTNRARSYLNTRVPR